MNITKQYLIEHYVRLRKTQKQIAKECGLSQAMISLHMKEFGIAPRNAGRQTIDLAGQKFDKLTVVTRVVGSDKSHPTWQCKCECGNTCRASTCNLQKRITVSCPECGRKRTGKSLWKGVGEISGKFWAQIKWSAQTRNLSFDITQEYVWKLYVEQRGRCALTGVAISIQRNNKNTASLDRIDSSKHYIEGNVQWIHKRLNWMKGNMSETDFVDWCGKVWSFRKPPKDE